ncbi:S16 family serine protease [Metaplanococcus flavidus]|uniref:S16 family serine protease n=1 Tax=Metaplanococcus flavidus TaxID=569883 RepID=A0ABW3LF91_9BACL
MISRFLLSIIAIIVFYIGLSVAFYFDLINTFIVVGVLFLIFTAAMIALIRYRHEKSKANKISLVVVLVGLLFSYDSLLVQYEHLTFRALVHLEPVEAADNSGINLMGVGISYVKFIDDEEWLVKNYGKSDQTLVHLDKMNNKIRYHSRNMAILQLLGIRNDEVSEMAGNVSEYLDYETTGIERFLESGNNSGDSAGLGLALTGLIEQNKLQNDLEFGVTGALDGHGEVSAIGMVTEKLMIAEEKEYPFMIVPSENADVAEKAKESQNLAIEIFAVSHIDEAVELINRLNEEHAE